MKKIFLYLIPLLLIACKKNDIYQYESDLDNITFNYFTSTGARDTSTISYSFASRIGLSADTIWIPVSLAGKREARDRKVKLGLVQTLTTATPDLHFEPLKEYYILPADSGKISVPLIIKNIDPELENKSVRLTVRAEQNEDFNALLPASIRSKSIVFSNRLEEPSWWRLWLSNLPAYSRTAHRLFLIAGGQDLVDTRAPGGSLGIPRTLYYLQNAKNFTTNPFAWVAQYPEKGYVLTKRNDGTEDYDFYQKDAPQVKLHLKFFPQVNGHFFISETGSQIIFK